MYYNANIQIIVNPKFSANIQVDERLGQLRLESDPYKNVTGLADQTEKWQFGFDKVFTQSATQRMVFEEVSQLVKSALDGYKVAIFAYGQTGEKI
jgi:hypothetical protein